MTPRLEMGSNDVRNTPIEIGYHYEKLHLLKPHYPITKTQKTTHIQLFYNYPLGITTTMQLSP